MIKDLRKLFLKVSIKVNPSDCRNKDVHLLLSDYLYKELKTEGIDVKRNNVNLIVSFKDNTRLIVDCLDGHIYIDNNDSHKPIGKLRRFNMKRSGEAYDCAVQNAKRIINKIKAIQNEINNDNVIFKTASLKDMRKKADLVKERECAIVVINSTDVVEAYTHSEAINNYLTKNKNEELNEKYYRITTYDLETPIENLEDRRKNLSDGAAEQIDDVITIKENIQSLAFAHKMRDYTIRLETDTLWECNANDIALTLKQNYQDYDILDDCSFKGRKLARIIDKRLKKTTIINDLRSNKKTIISDLRSTHKVLIER